MRQYSVLLVDDDVSFLGEMNEALSDDGYKIFTAITGNEAQEILEKNHVDVALLDKKLPDSDGQELVKRFKKISKDTDFIMVTAYASLESAVEGYGNGVLDYIMKPASVEDVINKVANVIDKKEERLSQINRAELDYYIQNRKYQSLFEGTSDAIIIVDMETESVVECNSAVYNLTEYKHEDLVGKRPFLFFPESRLEELYNEYLEIVKVGAGVLEIEIITKSGDSVPVSLSLTVFTIAEKKYVQEVYRDLREVKNIQERLVSLEKYDELKSEFVANVAHELINPLGVVKAGIENVIDGICGKIDKKAQETLEIASREINRLVSFSHNMLDLSKIESGKMPLSVSEINVRNLFDDIIAFYQPKFKTEGVLLCAEYDSVPDVILGDRDLIEQVVINLLSNSLRHTPENKNVYLRAYESGDYLMFEIEDEGPGIPEEEKRKIFNKYYRVFADKNEGTGLGLSIVEKIVSIHSGEVWVETGSRGGALFKVKLPVDNSVFE